MDASILKDALAYAVDQSRPLVVDVDGRSKFALWPDGKAEELIPAEKLPRPDTLELSSLDALVMMVRTEGLRDLNTDVSDKLYITIPKADSAVCFTCPDFDDNGYRRIFYEAKAVDVPGWNEDTQMGFEEAQIALRTRFQHTEDAEYCLMLLSQISTGAKVTYSDNGIATSVVTQKGVALQENQTIRPLVKLRPYRTFQEVEQPLSEFHIRISERGIRFIESDGGMWKLDARRTVKAYLEEQLREEIESGHLMIAL